MSVAHRETPLLEVRNVSKSYPVSGGFWRKKRQPVLRDVNLTLSEGSSVGLIGESGGGKSTLGRLILGLEQPDSGQVFLEGRPVQVWSKEHPGQMSVVFQDYTSSANPRFTVEELIREPLDILRLDASCAIPELLERVGLPKALRNRYPHELSGGQLQRVCIARAIATKPRFIVFDEAVSSLDVSVQAQVLELLLELKGDMTYLFIAHDVQAVTYLCDHIMFLHEGTIAESLEKEHLARASSGYAQGLLQSVIPFNPDACVATV
ncbi:ABC transporter ATP-binding protein [Bilophila wadsworthia]|uniref:ABC transporter ATP-binding protein n=1 Tax=Bilophila wadsworthia TaxID=35833 RepID=UPI003AF13F3C